MKNLLRFSWHTFVGWKEDRCHTYGTALAYFALLAIPSFFILLVMILEKIAGPGAVEGQVIPFIENWLNPHVAKLILYFVIHVRKFGLDQSVTITAIVSAAFGMGGFSGQLRHAIRMIWGRKTAEVSPAEFLRERAWELFGSLLIVSFTVVGVALRIIVRDASGYGPSESLPLLGTITELLWSGFYWSLLCAVVYKVLIPSPMRFRLLLPGALLTGFSLSIGRLFLHRFIPKEVDTVPGMMGNFLFTMLAVYFFCQIFLVGTEMTRVIAGYGNLGIHRTSGKSTEPPTLRIATK
jgi:uncharacterized BrkB/YihY/UPF0761 family membrane protein